MVLYSAAFPAKVLQTLVNWLNWISPLSLPPLWWDPVEFALDETTKLQHWLLYTTEKLSPAERRGRWRFYSWSGLLCDLEEVASLQQLPSYLHFLYPGCWGCKVLFGGRIVSACLWSGSPAIILMGILKLFCDIPKTRFPDRRYRFYWQEKYVLLSLWKWRNKHKNSKAERQDLLVAISGDLTKIIQVSQYLHKQFNSACN